MGRWIKKTAVTGAFVAGLLVGSPIAVMASSAYYEWVNLGYNNKVEVTTQAIAFNGHPYLLATDVEKYLHDMGAGVKWTGRTLETYSVSSGAVASHGNQGTVTFGKSASLPTFDASKLPQTFVTKSGYTIVFNSITLSKEHATINVTITEGPNVSSSYPIFSLGSIEIGPTSYSLSGRSSVLSMGNLSFFAASQQVSGNLYYASIPLQASHFILVWQDSKNKTYEIQFNLTK